MPHIEFGFTAPAFTIILLLVAAVSISYFIYRYTVPPVGRPRRLLLTLLRALSLFLLLAFLFEPLLRLVFTSEQPPVVAILLDNSKSMRIVDKTVNRKIELQGILTSGPLKNLRAKTLYFTFGSALSAVGPTPPETLVLNEDATDISVPFRTLAIEQKDENIRAVLLVTDGAYNLGQNPIYEAEQLGVPVYTVGIGDSSEQKDVLIARVAANDLVYNGTQVPVDVTVKSSGYHEERVDVTLREGGRDLDHTTVALGTGTREHSVRLTYVPQGEGLRKYTVKISPLSGELTTENNQRSFFAKVLKDKLRILIIGGAPSPDISSVRQTLTEEKNLQVRTFTQKVSGDFYEGALSAQPFDSADCIVLIGFPTSSTSNATLDLLRSALVEHNTPVLFIGGRFVDYGRLQTLAGVLPFTTLNVSTAEDYAFFQPSDAQRLNPVLAIPESNGEIAWNRLPPIFKTLTSFKARPEATVLGFPRVQGIVLSEPMILTRNLNKQKSLAVLGYGLWRWRLMSQGTPETEHVLSRFLAISIRWLTTHENSRPVRVTTTKEFYTQGEPVEFQGQVYDAAMQPIENAQLRVRIRRGEKESETVLRPIGSGRYEGSIDGLDEGDYTIVASAQADGQLLGEDNGRFTVGELGLEFQDTKMNVHLLRQIAHRTGGRYYTPRDLSGLPNDIAAQPSFTSHESVRTSSLELWNWRYSLALFVLLLGVEWFVRKRSGML